MGIVMQSDKTEFTLMLFCQRLIVFKFNQYDEIESVVWVMKLFSYLTFSPRFHECF